MRSRIGCVALVTSLAASCNCGSPATPEECSRDGGDYLSGLSIDALASQQHTSDAGVTVPLRIRATAPCLRGGARATATTSAGTIGGAAPGASTTVFLAPTEADLQAGQLAGDVELFLPFERAARVEVDLLDESRARVFGLRDDGGVLADP